MRLLFTALLCAAALLALPAAAEDYYAPRDWSKDSKGKMNISAYLFRDMNRNGIYDLPDRPMEDIVVEMTRPNGETAIRRTNSNGFGNFSMSLHDEKAMIREEGDYSFDVIVPEGWSITTGHKVQTKAFRFFPGAVGDMVADPPFIAVGLAQDFRVYGRVADAEPGSRVTLSDAAGDTQSGALAEDGAFSLATGAGPWTLAVDYGESGARVERSLAARNTRVQVAAIRRGSEPAPQAHEVVADFEGITEKNLREMPNGVAGLMWWNVVALRVDIAYTNNAMSGHYIAYNSSGHPARIYHEAPFDFAGGYFGVAWARANGETLRLRGWRGETLVYEDEIELSYLGPVWFDADYRGITRLDLETAHYWQYVSDDLVFRLPQAPSGN